MRTITTIICLLVLTVCLTASDRKQRGRAAWAWASVKPVPTLNAAPVKTTATDALSEVNAARAQRGLPPFQHDPLLTQAAQKAVQLRAANGIAGHLASDFDCLPTGASADAAGCGALEDSWGWGTCCTYDNYTHAGAAWVRGSDGRRYMHLFVRNQPSGTIRIVNQSSANCVP